MMAKKLKITEITAKAVGITTPTEKLNPDPFIVRNRTGLRRFKFPSTRNAMQIPKRIAPIPPSQIKLFSISSIFTEREILLDPRISFVLNLPIEVAPCTHLHMLAKRSLRRHVTSASVTNWFRNRDLNPASNNFTEMSISSQYVSSGNPPTDRIAATLKQAVVPLNKTVSWASF